MRDLRTTIRQGSQFDTTAKGVAGTRLHFNGTLNDEHGEVTDSSSKERKISWPDAR